jgi:hypothetical protein
MYEGLAAMEKAPSPTTDDWRVVSDAVNLMETLIETMQVCEDSSGLLMDAITAMAHAGRRNLAGARSGWMVLASRPCVPCWRITPRCWMCCLQGP